MADEQSTPVEAIEAQAVTLEPTVPAAVMAGAPVVATDPAPVAEAEPTSTDGDRLEALMASLPDNCAHDLVRGAFCRSAGDTNEKGKADGATLIQRYIDACAACPIDADPASEAALSLAAVEQGLRAYVFGGVPAGAQLAG